jgi:hypothetical protein
MNKPSINLLELLITLYADQMGVEISYELKEKPSEAINETHKRAEKVA